MKTGHDRLAKAGLLGLAAALCALAVPTTVAAVGNAESVRDDATADYLQFTPAGIDPAKFQALAERIGVDALRFTPAARPAPKDGAVTIAVRVDTEKAQAISVRRPVETVSNAPRIEALSVAPTRYDLGVARGYQGFAKAERPSVAPGTSVRMPSSVRNIAMPDLSEYRPAKSKDEPSRFQPRIALDSEGRTGRARGTLESLGEQSVEVSGSYSLSRKIDVTAGVRLSQDRDRLAPLTDGQDDDQAVYVGTQIRF